MQNLLFIHNLSSKSFRNTVCLPGTCNRGVTSLHPSSSEGVFWENPHPTATTVLFHGKGWKHATWLLLTEFRAASSHTTTASIWRKLLCYRRALKHLACSSTGQLPSTELWHEIFYSPSAVPTLPECLGSVKADFLTLHLAHVRGGETKSSHVGSVQPCSHTHLNLMWPTPALAAYRYGWA